MNKTKLNKILITVLCFAMVVSLSATVFAGEELFNKLDGTGANVDTTGITTIGNSVIVVLRTVGIVASVIILMVLGIKYMMGSAEEKAEYKKNFITFIV